MYKVYQVQSEDYPDTWGKYGYHNDMMDRCSLQGAPVHENPFFQNDVFGEGSHAEQFK